MAKTSGQAEQDRPNDKKPSLSVFFPCHNEQEHIAKLVNQTLGVLEDTCGDFEVIIVDDGSRDRTAAIADELAGEDTRIRVVHHPTNMGYGAALQSGFKAACKELVFYTDGDAQFDIRELPPLLELIEQYDIVSCYRRKRQDNLVRRIIGWGWTQLVCVLFSMRIRDIDCAFKLYRRDIFDNIKMVSTGALIDAEILARATRKGYTVVQRPVSHFPRTEGQQSGANLAVILRAFKELLRLRRQILQDS